jgi:hypothetical protein
MSYNFGEIIKKLYFLVSRKPARGLPTPSPPPLCKLPPHIFHVVDGKVRFAGATFTREIHSREGRGEGGVICETMPFDDGSWDRQQFNTKIDNSFLLLCYLDKICQIPTGDLLQALADLYSEARL